MGFWEAIVMIVAISVISKTVVRIKEARVRDTRERERMYIQSLEKRIEGLQGEMLMLRGEVEELQEQNEKLEEHFDFVNRLLEQKK